jgi:hypothetical protein
MENQEKIETKKSVEKTVEGSVKNRKVINHIISERRSYFVEGKEVYVYFPFGLRALVFDGRRGPDDYEDAPAVDIVQRKLPDKMRDLKRVYPDIISRINGYLIEGDVGLKSIEQVPGGDFVNETKIRDIFVQLGVCVEANEQNKKKLEELFGI